jgi:hypothetical protein
MNVALVVIISLIIIVPVLVAGGVMMYQSHKTQRLAEASQDKERSVSTDVAVDVETGARLRDIVVENFRRKRASLEDVGASEIAATRSTSTASSDRRRLREPRSSKRLNRKVQLTKVQSEDAETRVPSTAAVEV